MTSSDTPCVPGRTFPLAVAPNGARRTAADHPALPLDAKALATTAIAVADLGASVLHLHVRDTRGRHVLDADRYREASRRIRDLVGDRLVVQITTEAVGQYLPEAQIAVVQAVRPEAVSLALKELCAGADDEARFAAFLSWLRRERVTPQIILYDPREVARLNDMVDRGLLPAPEVLYVLGRYADGGLSSPPDLLPFLAMAGGRYPDFTVCAFGYREAACTAAGVLLGGGARVGFENNLQFPDGSIAPDNAALVRALVGPLADMGYRPETVDDLRERMAARFA